MSTPFLQPLDPQPAPDPVTPQASPSDPAGYASVTPHGQGPAPYDIQDPGYSGGGLQSEVTTAFNSANAVAGAGVLYGQGPRQAETERLLSSPQGYHEQDITAGWSGGGGDTGWPNNPSPPMLNTPDQGQMGTYPANTGTD